ncbi:putative oligoribonuclease isoform X2 [Lycorma delicatula]|uniref:putative oligoribonuclease isoform X2 n=1 Tax=Lycorma delicatula TaxID=130591 RepID=UPI003F51A9A7
MFLKVWFRNMITTINQNGSDRLVWIDMEMTGLDPEKHHILEIACIVTDCNLNVIVESPSIVIHQPDEVLSGMNEWCRIHHGLSGLWRESCRSKISVKEAEDSCLDLVRANTPQGICPLAGNSVYGDRMFLKKYMPRLDAYLHYRIVDVSTVKELCRRWFPAEYNNAPKKKLAHRSLDDIRESIEELKYYKCTIFNAEPFSKISWC